MNSLHRRVTSIISMAVYEHANYPAKIATEIIELVEKDIASRNGVSVARDTPTTSKNAAMGILPRTGSIQARMYDLYRAQGDLGFIDSEIEQMMGLRHQSASAARKRLCDRGLLKKSGRTRKTPGGFDAEVYVATSASKEDDAECHDESPTASSPIACPHCGRTDRIQGGRIPIGNYRYYGCFHDHSPELTRQGYSWVGPHYFRFPR